MTMVQKIKIVHVTAKMGQIIFNGIHTLGPNNSAIQSRSYPVPCMLDIIPVPCNSVCTEERQNLKDKEMYFGSIIDTIYIKKQKKNRTHIIQL